MHHSKSEMTCNANSDSKPALAVLEIASGVFSICPNACLAGETKRGTGRERGTGVQFKEKRAADVHHRSLFEW
jgi:hypothetical protein